MLGYEHEYKPILFTRIFRTEFSWNFPHNSLKEIYFSQHSKRLTTSFLHHRNRVLSSFRLEDYRTIPRHTRRSIIHLITKTDVTLTFGRRITTHTFPHPRSSTIRQDQPYSAAAQTALLTRACGRSVIPVITYGKTSIIFGDPRSCEQRKRVKGRASGAGSGTV